MKFSAHTDLFSFNTFGIHAEAKHFTNVNSIEEFQEVRENQLFHENKRLILGGGSNILLTGAFDGLVIKNDILGIELLEENNEEVLVKVGAGENWHQFVMHCIDKDYAGLENLSLIPGNVGASPMQNIGAYGVEVKDRIVGVDCVSLEDGNLQTFTAEECQFDYRSSIFKTSHRDQFFISHVVFRLSKKPQFNTSYGAIEAELEKMGVQELSIRSVSNAVINIRSSKLPDPAEIGNAGSFFKNPVVENRKVDELRSKYTDMPTYKVDDAHSKIPAGWMIEKLGWKGKTLGDYGVHKNQALVLVNYGGASGNDIKVLSDDIQKSVHTEFGILLEKEVNII